MVYLINSIKIVAILAILFSACGPSPEEQRAAARDALAARNIEYSNESLVRVAAAGDSAAAALLIQAGIFPDLSMRNGMTPLMIASAKGHVPVVRLLVAHGANVNARQPNGASVLDIALLGEQAINPNASHAYLNTPDKKVINRKIRLVDLLLNAGAEVEADSYTLLMQGVKAAVEPGGSTRILQQLLDAGADVNQRPAWGKSILMLGIESMQYRPNLEVVRLLLEKGANVNDRFINPRNPAEQMTAISIANSKNFRESVGGTLADQLIRLLQEAGA
jgi:ankyrin repeat protein